MIKRTILFILVGLTIFSIISCSKTDDNDITIAFISPTADNVLSDKSSVLIHITFEATDENHEVKVKLYPDGDPANPIINWKQHSHRKKIEFRQTIDLSSFVSATKFHLEAIACLDEDCTTEKSDSIYFTIP